MAGNGSRERLGDVGGDYSRFADATVYGRVDGHNIFVIRPSNPSIPLEEGNHFLIPYQEGKLPDQLLAREMLIRAYFAVPVARAIAEGSTSSDQWANIVFDADGVNIFGRNPDSEVGWGKPVVRRRGISDEITDVQGSGLAREIGEELSAAEQNLAAISLFKDGINPLDPQSSDFLQEDEYIRGFGGSKVLWANDKFLLINIADRHLNGIHISVYPRRSYLQRIGAFRNAWQTTNNSGNTTNDFLISYLEATSILIGAQRLLVQGAGLGYNSEIHFLGNWAFLSPAQYPIDFSRASFHGHLYAPESPDTTVILPSRRRSEAPDDWQGIVPISGQTVEIMQSRLQEGLTDFLSRECSGALVV